MDDPAEEKTKSFTAFRSAAEEARTKREHDAITREEPAGDNEGGHMSSIAGRVTQMPGASLPYVVTLTHHACEETKHSFRSMREAEAFIQRNTPVPHQALSSRYDQPASDFGAPKRREESIMNDEDILARLKVIDQRLRQISTKDAASVLAGGMASAGIHEQERLRLIAETERILDELDGNNHD